MGLSGVKSAAPTSALTPAPASLQRVSSFTAAPALEGKKSCDCGAPSGLSGRCAPCDGLGLVSARAKAGPGGLAASPAPAAFEPVAGKRAPLPALSPIRLQTQLRVSAPSDAAEIEAQAIGRLIAHLPGSPRGPLAPHGARSGAVRRRAIQPSFASAPVVKGIESSRSGGMALPASVRAFMEPRFGADFSGVRIHTGPEAAALSGQLNAHAFTTGRDVYFNDGQFRPDTAEGRELIAHELAHTIQQGAASQRSASQALVAESAGVAVQREVAANVGSGAPPGAQSPPATAPAGGANADDGRTYHMADGRTIELPDDMTVEEAHKLEMDGLAAKKRLGRGPPPKPLPDVHKPADKSAKTAVKPKPGHGKGAHHSQAAARHSGGLKKVLLHPLRSAVGQYLIAKAAPVLSKGGAKLAALERHEQTHDTAGQKVRQAENAVVIPESEGQSKSNSAQVGAVAERPAPPPDETKGQTQLLQSLQDNVPQTIEDVDNFKRDMKAQHTGADVTKVVQSDKNAVVGAFSDMEHTPPPAPPEHVPEALPPPEPAPRTPGMDLGKDAIAPLLPEHTDASQYTKDGDAMLKKEGVTQEQLDMVDSGDLAFANKEKKGLEKSAKSEPLAVRQFSEEASAKVDQELQDEEQAGREHLAGHRKQGLHQTAKHQESAKIVLEKKRDEVAAKINGIYQTTQDLVTKKLTDLDAQSMMRFDQGNEGAAKAFEDNVNRELDAYKEDRYSGWFGWARRAKDWLLGMDELPRVKEIFETNRETFVQTINKLVADISADGKRVVQECKDQLAKAKADIKDYVDKLAPNLKAIADKTAGEVGGKLDALDDTIKQKSEELQQKLADKQQAAIKAIDDKIAKMKEAMSGALAKLGNLLLYAAKKFFTWALKQFGYSLSDIERIIDKGIAVLKAIFTQPIAFVKNLIAAAKLGFSNFGANFLMHLKDSIFDWLTGSLDGVALPSSWDFKGIAGVAFQILGLTWANIRGKLVGQLGEPAVKALEGGFDLVVSLVRDGPMAAWEKLQEMGQEIKQAFIDGVKDFIKTKIIQEAIKTILALFVPGAGIVRAIVAIYDTVMFFIQKAKQIIEMIGNFLGSIGEIAAGNIGAAADALEKGLARGLTLVINFLARFLRLEGITAKIRVAIEKLRARVDKGLDTVVGWLIGKAKAGSAALFGARGKDGENVPNKDRLDSTAMQSLPLKLGDEDHELFARVSDGHVVLEMASLKKGDIDIVLGRINMLCNKALADYGPALAANPDKKKKIQDEMEIITIVEAETRKSYRGPGSAYLEIENIISGTEDRYANLSKAGRKIAAEKYLRDYIGGIARKLAAGAKLGIGTLEGFKFKSGYVDDAGVLLPQYQGKVREKFYNFDWEAAALIFKSGQLTASRIKAQKHDPTIGTRPDKDHFYLSEDTSKNATLTPEIADDRTPDGKPELDHRQPLGDRWSSGSPVPGNNTDQLTRGVSYQKDIQVLSKRMNGLKSGPAFSNQVGTGFRGPADPP